MTIWYNFCSKHYLNYKNREIMMENQQHSIQELFGIHSYLVDHLWGTPEDVVVGKISEELIIEIKNDFCTNFSFSESAQHILDVQNHPTLSTGKPRPEVLETLNQNIVAGNLHQFSNAHQTVQKLHNELRQMFKVYVGSPFVFINTRIWKTKPLSKRFGPNDWHTDGFAPGHMKIMVYLTPLNPEHGCFSWKDRSGMTHHLDNEPEGTAVCFRNSDVSHTGVPGTTHERISIEVTLMRSLVDGEQEWPGHFLGRHLKSPKQLENVSKADVSVNINNVGTKFFISPDVEDCVKVNIGSGARNWPGWVCLDELDSIGVTKMKFHERCDFPIDESSVSLFYSSHFFEHVSDPVVSRVLMEMKKCAKPGALFILKIPDFSWFLEQYKFSIRESMKNKGIESVLWSWRSNAVEDTFENRLAMMFCGIWNQAYGDHFSNNINYNGKGAYHGPPRLPSPKIKHLLNSNSPNKISRELVRVASEEKTLKSFNHQNAWSEAEIVELLSKFQIDVLNNHRNLICDQFKEIIPDLEDMKNWSAYYLCRFNF